MQHGTETLLTYNVQITFTNKPTNLVFYSDSQKTNAIIIADNKLVLDGFMSLSDNKKRDIPIYWDWELETGSTQKEIDDNDEIDTTFIGKTMSMQIATTGKQVTENPLATQYAVTFDANGGTIQGYGNSSQATKMVTYGEIYGNLPTPTREGYTFKGWNGKNKFNINKMHNVHHNEYDIIIENNTIFLTGIRYACNTQMLLKEVLTDVNTGEIITFSFVSSGGYGFIYLYPNGGRWDSKTSKTITDQMLDNYFIIYNNDNLDEPYTVEISNMQMEVGLESTDYEPYYITSSTEVVQNQNHTLTAIWEPNE